jgi:hypothetical protein
VRLPPEKSMNKAYTPKRDAAMRNGWRNGIYGR